MKGGFEDPLNSMGRLYLLPSLCELLNLRLGFILSLYSGKHVSEYKILKQGEAGP